MVDALEVRLRKLEDEREIVRTLQMYGHALDYGFEDEFVDCWLQDGVLVWPAPHPQYVGHEALRTIFRKHTHAPAPFHKHVVVDPMITLEGDRATVDSMFLRLDDYEDGPQVSSYGRYRDEMRRCPDGRWRFMTRMTEREANREARVPTFTAEIGA